MRQIQSGEGLARVKLAVKRMHAGCCNRFRQQKQQKQNDAHVISRNARNKFLNDNAWLFPRSLIGSFSYRLLVSHLSRNVRTGETAFLKTREIHSRNSASLYVVSFLLRKQTIKDRWRLANLALQNPSLLPNADIGLAILASRGVSNKITFVFTQQRLLVPAG